jgi:hypothetical protein
VIPCDIDRTHVVYHGWDYTVNDLESGDLIAYLPVTRDRNYVDTIRIEEPVQARPSTARRAPLPPRNDVVEGTVQRVDIDRGLFDIRPPSGGTVTVSVPYNARATDVDYFRRLRRGDSVRVEGEFVAWLFASSKDVYGAAREQRYDQQRDQRLQHHQYFCPA